MHGGRTRLRNTWLGSRRCFLTARVDASAVATFLECPGSIGVVAIDSGDIFVVLVDVGRGRVLVEVVMAGVITDEKVGDEVLCDTRVPGVARHHDRDGDDLGVGVDRRMSPQCRVSRNAA